MQSHHQDNPKTRIRRGAKRASYESEVIKDILDSNYICHVGFMAAGESRVIPTAYVRVGNALYLHGHLRNQMMAALVDGQTACVSVCEVNGLVLARSGFHHSLNYRSVVLFSRGRVVEGARKAEVLDALVDHLVPGRAREIREHTAQELAATLVVELPIEEVSAKVRQGPPVDAEADYGLDIWAGVVPLKTVPGEVENCPRVVEGVELPRHLRDYLEGFGEPR